jgi:putative oxidoreductase
MALSDLGLLILRIVIGLTLAGHGAQKLFGWWGGPGIAGWIESMRKLRMRPPVLFAWLAALSEFGGGLLVALGLLSPLGNCLIAGAMVVAIATVHLSRGFWVSKGGYEFNLLIIAAVLMLALVGPGAYSVDQLLPVRLPEPMTVIAAGLATIIGVAATLLTRSPKEAPKSQSS